MSVRKFSRKIITMTIICAAIIVIVNVSLGFASVFVQNQLALGQMQNSNEAYAALLVFSSILRYRGMVNFFILLVFSGCTSREVHKYHKKVEGENNK